MAKTKEKDKHYKRLYRKLKLEEHESHLKQVNSGAPEHLLIYKSY